MIDPKGVIHDVAAAFVRTYYEGGWRFFYTFADSVEQLKS